MKINLDGMEIEIKAKFEYEARCNKEAALSVLNELIIVYHEAAERYATLGVDALRKSYKRKADALYEVCRENGLYK